MNKKSLNINIIDNIKDNIEKKFLKYSFFIFFFLIIISWSYIITSENDIFSSIFQEKNIMFFNRFIKRLFGVGETNPAYLDKSMWREAIKLSLQTVEMSIIATGIATIFMLLIVIFSARNIKNGVLTSNKKWYIYIFYYFSRIIFLITRAIPELLWAMILVYILKPGILPGALALALHNFGVLGKLCGEVIEDIEDNPIKNMSLNGASQSQIMLYGIFPTILPKYLNYILYRFENIIRATLIVGFVGAGGLGLNFKLAMSHFKYSEILLYLLCYLILVYMTDIIIHFLNKFIK